MGQRGGDATAAGDRAGGDRAGGDRTGGDQLEPAGSGPALLSFLLDASGAPAGALEATWASLVAQSDPGWQLCAVSAPDLPGPLVAAARAEGVRVDLRRSPRGRHPLNAALARARGTYCAVLDPGDVLVGQAVERLARTLRERSATRVLYTDEDALSVLGGWTAPFHKPDFSPDYLLGFPYLGRLSLYARDLLTELGGFRGDLPGAAEWDLALRATRRAGGAEHLREILVHRARPPVRAGTAVPPYRLPEEPAEVRAASERACLAAALASRGVPGDPEPTPWPSTWRIRRRLPPGPRPTVSVLLPTAGAHGPVHGVQVLLAEQCVRALVGPGAYRPIEVLCVLGDEAPSGLAERLRAAGGPLLRCLRAPSGEFNFAARMDLAAAAARGELLLLLNDDIVPLVPDWLERMVALLASTGAGAVGAKLSYPDGRIQHAGVVEVRRLPQHLHVGEPDGFGHFADLQCAIDLTAVTGACLLTSRAAFADVGGLSPEYPLNFNDVDFCLKLRASGRRVLLCPEARLVHYESASRHRVVYTEEVEHFERDWGWRLGDDPFFSPHRPPPMRPAERPPVPSVSELAADVGP